MGRDLASSKSKKNSEVDRRKRKNTKSRKRRRVSFSPSNSSSDADDVSLRRRRSHRMPEKKRGRDPKRSVKRSRKARHRSVSSASSDSSSSCSTCRSWGSGSLNRSRSPTRGRNGRKGKLKKKKVERGRKLDRVVRSLKSRNRSLSCSTCSGSSGPIQTDSYREAKNKERDGSRQIGSSSAIESRGEVEERYGSRDREIDNEMIMANYDGSQLSRANVGGDLDRVMDEGSYEQGTEIDRWMSDVNFENDSYFDQFEDSLTQTYEPYKELELNAKLPIRIKSEIVAADIQDTESDDLELTLRQKALENLTKLRCDISSNSRTNDDRKEELAGVESSEKQCETAKKVISSPKSHSIVSKERHIHLGVPLHDSKVKSFMQLPSMEANYFTSDKKMLSCRLNQSSNSKQLESSISGQSTSNPPNDIEDSPEKMSHRQSPCRVSQEKNVTEGSGSGNSLRSEVNLGEGKEKIGENNETMDERQSGSQFEQKTFSRMHDGEMVQVSYKVYIPKKTPALARRKLQR